MRRALRLGAIVCAVIIILLVFNSQEIAASPPTGSEYNHALASNGGQATASGSSGTNSPGKAIDASLTSYWESSTTTGWLVVQFLSRASVNEVHAHFTGTVYARLSVYLDTSGNGGYESGERVWTTTTNPGLDVIVILASTHYAFGVRIAIDGSVGTNRPKIVEFEAYLGYDSDGDGLTNDQETGTIYFQRTTLGDLGAALADDGQNATAVSATILPWSGVLQEAFVNLTVDHAVPSQLTVQLGYWDGSA